MNEPMTWQSPRIERLDAVTDAANASNGGTGADATVYSSVPT